MGIHGPGKHKTTKSKPKAAPKAKAAPKTKSKPKKRGMGY